MHVPDSGVRSGCLDGVVDTGSRNGAATVGEQQRTVLPLRPGRKPLIDHHLQLRVQRHIAIVVEFADRDPQPVGRSDLDHGVDRQAEEFALAHPGPGEQFDREATELVVKLSRSGHEFRVRGVIEKPW